MADRRVSRDAAARLPGPPELLPGRPDAIVDLQTDEGVALVGGQWRYSDARVEEIDFVELGSAGRPARARARCRTAPTTWCRTPRRPTSTTRRGGVLAPGGHDAPAVRTAGSASTGTGIAVTLPERDRRPRPDRRRPSSSRSSIDDYAEVWVNGALPLALGDTGGPVVAGFNAPNRVVLTRDARPGRPFAIAVFGINGPISASPRNYIWMRTATLDVYAPERAGRPSRAVEVSAPLRARRDRAARRRARAGRRRLRVHRGPGLVARRRAALQLAEHQRDLPAGPRRARSRCSARKSGYTGVDIGRYPSRGRTGSPSTREGRLTICQHGNRRVIRVEPHGDITVLADSLRGEAAQQPQRPRLPLGRDACTSPTRRSGCRQAFDDPDKELDFSGVFRSRDGEIALIDDELDGPERDRVLPGRALPLRRQLGPGRARSSCATRSRGRRRVSTASVFFDMTDAPGEDAIDGLKVDVAGNLYVCGPGGIWVLSAGGRAPRPDPSCPRTRTTWPGATRTAARLYITALTSVYRMRLSVAGHPPAP